jgi:phospholipid transport system transporter-binding protein
MTFKPAPSLTVDNARGMLADGIAAITGGQRVIDFSGLTQVDSAAVAVLLSWQRAARARSIALSFINMPEMLQSLTTLYGVAALLPTQHDVSSFMPPAATAPARNDLPHH